MKSSTHWLGRQIAVLVILLLTFPASEIAMAQQPVEHGSKTAAPANAERSPGGAAIAEDELPDNPEPANPQATPPPQQTPAPPAGSGQSHKPVGTAAAPYEPTVGIAASRPAGAAIAPAKQRRVRTIIISLGVIAGAGIAVGSVAALSHGSPSRP